MTENTEAIKGKVDKSDHLFKMYMDINTVNKETNEKNICSLYDKGLISPIHKRFLVYEKKRSTTQ